jgi:Protein of unknown function (DUF3500)
LQLQEEPMSQDRTFDCPECHAQQDDVTRRDFMKGVGSAALASAAALQVYAIPRSSAASLPDKSPTPETAVRRLYDSLSPDQRAVICMPWEHDLRQKYGANWKITPPALGDFFNAEQQETIREIFRGVTSGDGYERFMKQMAEDYGGIAKYHIAIFGEPGRGKFEWVMSGRHLTIRCDGTFDDGTAFGGPIVYGHGAGDSQQGLPGNVFYYQTLKANEVFKSLDGKQRAKALLDRAPAEAAVEIHGAGAKFPGIPISELASDQKQLVQNVMKELLAPYREDDVREALGCLNTAGGLEKVHMAFYQQGDIGDDEVWDIWRIEGPSLVCHFRGSPHVHAYINIATKTG